MLKHFKLLGVLLAAVILSISSQVYAAPDWNAGTIRATGTGVANPALVRIPAQGQMLARRAAVADAYRQLAEAVQGVNVDAETTVENMMLTSDVVKTRVSAIIKGAQVVDEGPLEGGGYYVTMEIPMFGGSGGLADTVFERPATIEPFPAPAPSYEPPPPVVQGRSAGGYTGLIVDCRGLNTINPVMSPVIKNARGQKIYGHKNLDYDRIIVEGMASYAQDMNQASRAGSNPLIVKAVALEDLNANPVLSVEDADMVLYENGQSHFLDNTAVVFLY